MPLKELLASFREKPAATSMLVFRRVLRWLLVFWWQTFLCSGLVALIVLYAVDQDACADPARIRGIAILSGFTAILAWKCFGFATKMIFLGKEQ